MNVITLSISRFLAGNSHQAVVPGPTKGDVYTPTNKYAFKEVVAVESNNHLNFK